MLALTWKHLSVGPVAGITAPDLKKLEIEFFNQLTFSVPHHLQFMNTTEYLTFKSAKFEFFREGVYVCRSRRLLSSYW